MVTGMIDATAGSLRDITIDSLCHASQAIKAARHPFTGLTRDETATLARIRAEVLARSPECEELL
jgi:hypothetical protein